MTERHHLVSQTSRPDVNNILNLQQDKDKTIEPFGKHHHLDYRVEEHNRHNPNHGHLHSTHHHLDEVQAYHPFNQNLLHRHQRLTCLHQNHMCQQRPRQLHSTRDQFLPLLEVSLRKILLDKLVGQLWWSQLRLPQACCTRTIRNR